MQREGDLKIFIVALSLAFVCSVVVSVTAVSLDPIQKKNAALNRNKNVLIAAGEFNSQTDVEKAFANISAGFVKMGEGEFNVSENVSDFYENLQQISSSEETSMRTENLNPDIGFSRVPSKMPAYIFRKDGKINKVVLMVYGKGLWSTLYGFICIAPDGRTVQGLTFYQHGETPGLGGKVDNKQWKEQWENKKVYDKSGDLRIQVIKGDVDKNADDAIYKIDGLSGATMTTNGVNNLVRFWMSEFAYGSFLEKFSSKGGVDE